MHRPRLKSIYTPVPAGGGRIRFGGGLGIASEIQDDDADHVWRLLWLLDGSRTVEQLAAAMPDVPPGDVAAAVATLQAGGLLEDAARDGDTHDLTPAELGRYRRSLDFYGFFNHPTATSFDFQARLKHSRVVVLGLGGLGSQVAMSLAATGVGHLVVVDHDQVELSNLNRQLLYTDADIGRSKVLAGAERLQLMNPHIEVTPWETAVAGVADAERCLGAGDVLICAADRPRIRLFEWLNEAALTRRKPWLRSSSEGLTVSFSLHVPGRTGCFACAETEACRTLPGYEEVSAYVRDDVADRTVNPCTAGVAGTAANIAALEVVRLLTGAADPVSLGRTVVVDLRELRTFRRPMPKLADCASCSPAADRSQIPSAPPA
ncbi:ThiF family adenylyltransferase [Streptomyces sp. NBC_01476]|uniref:HesA/MoeB/ThiF family protein n=1 Tax=Streptomyces sp. NBC_01476 TaxID=2903881 RepID=UPI002E2EFC0B|nr:ThiF family adenylyltransferase [Streptomyces sp. NBC_01476]